MSVSGFMWPSYDTRCSRMRTWQPHQVVLGRLAALLAAPLQGVQAGAAPEEPRFAESVAVRARIALLQVAAAGGVQPHAAQLPRLWLPSRVVAAAMATSAFGIPHVHTLLACRVQWCSCCSAGACGLCGVRKRLRRRGQPRCHPQSPAAHGAVRVAGTTVQLGGVTGAFMTTWVAGLNPRRRPSHYALPTSLHPAQAGLCPAAGSCWSCGLRCWSMQR